MYAPRIKSYEFMFSGRHPKDGYISYGEAVIKAYDMNSALLKLKADYVTFRIHYQGLTTAKLAKQHTPI